MSRRKQQQASVLPHLPKGASLPEIRVSNDKLIMPGQKSLPPDWRSNESNQQLQQYVPGADPGRTSMSRQGIPWTDRQSKLQMDSESEPPPLFSAAPRKVTLRHRETKSQKNIYSIDSGIDPVSLLTSRLDSWRLAVKNLVALFKHLIAVEIKTSRGMVNASKEIILPFRNSNGQFLETGSGGVQDVWASLRDYTMQHGILHHESAGYIEKAILPSLRAIKADIKTMITSIGKDKGLKSTLIFESRVQVDRLISRLDKIIQSVDRAPQDADRNTDPFLANLSIIHAVRELCDHENTLHDNILNLQKETGLFEQKIIENIRYILQKWQGYRLKHKMETEDNINMVIDTFNQIEPTTEWNEFVRRNQYNLILESSAYKTENMVEYPNQESKYCRALKIGPLQLKTGVMKSWTEGVYILTPAGFIHGYKTPKHFQTNPLRPSFSIFVPATTVEEDDNNRFELRGLDRRSSMGLGTHYIFRANNSRDAQEWVEALLRIVDQFRAVPLLDTAETGFSAVARHRDLPPLPPSILPVKNEPNRAIEASPNQMNAAGPSNLASVREQENEDEANAAPIQTPRDTAGMGAAEASGYGAGAGAGVGAGTTGAGAGAGGYGSSDTPGYGTNDVKTGGYDDSAAGTTGYGANNTTGYGANNTTGYGANNTTGCGANNTTGYGANDTTGYGANDTTGYGANDTNTGNKVSNAGATGYGAAAGATAAGATAVGATAAGEGSYSQDRGLLNDPGTPITPAPQRNFLHQEEFNKQPFDQRPIDERRNLSNNDWRDPDIDEYDSASHHSKTADVYDGTNDNVNPANTMGRQDNYAPLTYSNLQQHKGEATAL